MGGEGTKARLGMIAGVVLLRTLLQDRIARLNGRSVEHVLKQDRPAFLRLIALSVLQVLSLPSPPRSPPPIMRCRYDMHKVDSRPDRHPAGGAWCRCAQLLLVVTSGKG